MVSFFNLGNVAKNSWWKFVKKVLIFAASLKRTFALVETNKSAIKLANTRQNVALIRATFFVLSALLMAKKTHFSLEK